MHSKQVSTWEGEASPGDPGVRGWWPGARGREEEGHSSQGAHSLTGCSLTECKAAAVSEHNANLVLKLLPVLALGQRAVKQETDSHSVHVTEIFNRCQEVDSGIRA